MTLQTLTGHQTEVDCVMFEPAENVVAAGSRGGTIKIWDLTSEKCNCPFVLLRVVSRHAQTRPFDHSLTISSLRQALGRWQDTAPV